jgi:hypothetical protein
MPGGPSFWCFLAFWVLPLPLLCLPDPSSSCCSSWCCFQFLLASGTQDIKKSSGSRQLNVQPPRLPHLFPFRYPLDQSNAEFLLPCLLPSYLTRKPSPGYVPSLVGHRSHPMEGLLTVLFAAAG